MALPSHATFLLTHCIYGIQYGSTILLLLLAADWLHYIGYLLELSAHSSHMTIVAAGC